MGVKPLAQEDPVRAWRSSALGPFRMEALLDFDLDVTTVGEDEILFAGVFDPPAGGKLCLGTRGGLAIHA